MKNREKGLVITAFALVLLLIVVGGTYAYWTTTKTQKDENVINTTCLNITFKDGESDEGTSKGIQLDEAFPISDDEGLEHKGYTFSITNECDETVNYDVNLESLNISDYGDYTPITSEDSATITEAENKSQYLQSKYIKSNIYTDGEKGTTKLLNAYTSIKHSFLDEGKSYEKWNLLNKETLEPHKTKTHTLKLWVTNDAPDSQMLKHYQGKVIVYSWLGNSNPYPIGD